MFKLSGGEAPGVFYKHILLSWETIPCGFFGSDPSSGVCIHLSNVESWMSKVEQGFLDLTVVQGSQEDQVRYYVDDANDVKAPESSYRVCPRPDSQTNFGCMVELGGRWLVRTMFDEPVVFRASSVQDMLLFEQRFLAEDRNVWLPLETGHLVWNDASGNGLVSTLGKGQSADEYPHVILSEIAINPEGTDEVREFIELRNWGSESVSLKDWWFGFGKIIREREQTWTLPDVRLPPGAVLILAGEDFDPALWAMLPRGVRVIRFSMTLPSDLKQFSIGKGDWLYGRWVWAPSSVEGCLAYQGSLVFGAMAQTESCTPGW